MVRRFASTRVSRIIFLSTAVLVSWGALCLGQCEDDVVHTRSPWCPNAFFSFGDSLSDTGNKALVMPSQTACTTLPYGGSFFGGATGRCSDGRLVIDFMLLAFKLPLLFPYLLPSHDRDMQGLNFAYSGAPAREDSETRPFPLNYQVDQFIQLKNQVLQAQREQSLAQNLNELEQATYSTALYTICIGGNDLTDAIYYIREPKAVIRDIVPGVLDAIVSSVEALYFQGARKFMLFNGAPQGCGPKMLAMFDGSGFSVDKLGCMPAVNEICQAFNSELLKSVQRLRASLRNVTIAYFDYYAAHMEILTNPSKYGFNPDVLHTACCEPPGSGTLNVNNEPVMCGKNSRYCDTPNEYIAWDGYGHGTEAYYKQIAKFVLNGKFSDPSTNLTRACDLSFENFGHTTYDEIFHRNNRLSFDK